MSELYASENNGFKIEVATSFEFERSNPLEFHYLFSYKILITNTGDKPAQLISRLWNIEDAQKVKKIVEGPGVIGQTPHLKPGERFEYESFSPLPTLTGKMWGYFIMKDDEGKNFRIFTPEFFFQVPDEFIDQY